VIAVVAPLAIAGGALALLAALRSIGRLSDAERRQQRVYARFVGAPLDPALLDERREEVRRAAEAALGDRALSLGLLGHRNPGGAGIDWTRLALAVGDRQLLEGALTISRIEWAEAAPPERPRLHKRHRAVWQRLARLDAADGRPG
jgi:hypothetical protein